MADKKLTQLTEVSSLGADSLLYAVDPNRTVGDQSVGIKPENLPSVGGATLEQEVPQTAHGLVVGNWVRMDGSNFVKALADTATNAQAIGYVKAVADANTFTYQYGGIIAIAGLTDGNNYFLQDDGSIANTVGTVNLFVGTETPQGFLIEIGQGFEEGDATAPTQEQINGTRLVNATASGAINLDLNAYVKWNLTLTGAVTLTFTNLPTGDNVKVVEAMIDGAQTITFADTVLFDPDSDTYDGTKYNRYTFTIESDSIRAFRKQLENV